MVTAQKKKRHPCYLAHAVIGMFYSVVANQRQPQWTGSGGGGQCCACCTVRFRVVLRYSGILAVFLLAVKPHD